MQQSHWTPYGAYALKASYQRNMWLSVLIVALIATSGMISVLLIPAPPTVVVKMPDRYPTPPPRLIWNRGPAPPTPSPGCTGANLIGTIPNPVVDEPSVDVENAVLPTRDERAAGVGAGEPGGSDDGLPDGTGYGIVNGQEFWPHPDSFQAVEIMAELVYAPTPEYPRLAVRAGHEGTVWIKALVDKEGRVRDAMVARSIGVNSLNRAAVEAAFKCRYRPAIQNGRPVAVCVTYRVDFKLE